MVGASVAFTHSTINIQQIIIFITFGHEKRVVAQSVAMCEQLFVKITDMNGDLAQSVARWSHNPKVESSILSVPMFLDFSLGLLRLMVYLNFNGKPLELVFTLSSHEYEMTLCVKVASVFHQVDCISLKNLALLLDFKKCTPPHSIPQSISEINPTERNVILRGSYLSPSLSFFQIGSFTKFHAPCPHLGQFPISIRPTLV